MELAFLLSCFDPAKERTGRPCTAWQSEKVYGYPSSGGGRVCDGAELTSSAGRPTNRLEQGKGLLRMQ